ncbi:MAG: nucleoside-triphosphatase [Oscillospiraceae bacterium]|jgi:nucleoside-triphosphatase|nr:nucleoside-triphosphatase [Oscillospiraceae bacterium]
MSIQHKHVFLSGEIQIGKSTALRRFLAQTGIAADGFLTFFDPPFADTPDAPRHLSARALYLTKFDTALTPESRASESRHLLARVSEAEFTVLTETFETRGADILDAAGQRRLLLMDELGAMEEGAPRFKAAVLRRLDADFPIAGVVKLRASPFLDAVRAHPNVELLTVTAENRDAIPAALAARFAHLR